MQSVSTLPDLCVFTLRVDFTIIDGGAGERKERSSSYNVTVSLR